MALKLPPASEPLKDVPQPQSPRERYLPTNTTLRRALPASPVKGKERELTSYTDAELTEMLARTTQLLGSTSIPPALREPGSKLLLHQNSLEIELRHRKNDAQLRTTRLDEAEELSDAMNGLATGERNSTQELHTRLRQQPALDKGRMRGISMAEASALESNAAAKRRARQEQNEFTDRMMDEKWGVHRAPVEPDYPEDEDSASVDLDGDPDEYESSRGFGFGSAWASGYNRAVEEL